MGFIHIQDNRLIAQFLIEKLLKNMSLEERSPALSSQGKGLTRSMMS